MSNLAHKLSKIQRSGTASSLPRLHVTFLRILYIYVYIYVMCTFRTVDFIQSLAEIRFQFWGNLTSLGVSDSDLLPCLALSFSRPCCGKAGFVLRLAGQDLNPLKFLLVWRSADLKLHALPLGQKRLCGGGFCAIPPQLILKHFLRRMSLRIQD